MRLRGLIGFVCCRYPVFVELGLGKSFFCQRIHEIRLKLPNGLHRYRLHRRGIQVEWKGGIQAQGSFQLQDVLVEGLARGDAIGDVVQRVRRQVPPSGFDRFDWSAPYAATALWSNDPSMRLPSSGRT